MRVCLAILALCMTLPAQTYVAYRNLVYGTYKDKYSQTQNLLLDLYLPRNATAPSPLVIWVHGGGWRGGSKGNSDRGLTAHGFAVASINYRLSHQGIWPAQIHDCKGAVRWLRANAVKYNLDPDRFGAWGSSAGGHLVACMGTMGDVKSTRVGSKLMDLEGSIGGNLSYSSRVQAVVDWYGPTNFMAMIQFPSRINRSLATAPEALLIGKNILSDPELTLTADSTTFVSPQDAPMLIMHGTHDPTVPFNQSELLENQARYYAGMNVRFLPVQDAGHGGSKFTNAEVLAFLRRYLRDLPPLRVGIWVDDATAGEGGDTGAFRIRRSGSTASPLTITVHWVGTAIEGQDFQTVGSLVSIPAGQSFAPVIVRPVDDNLVEGSETVRLELCYDRKYRVDLSRVSAEVKLADDDNPTGLPLLSVSATDPRASETTPGQVKDPGIFRFTRTGSTLTPLALSYRLLGTSLNGVDYPLAAGKASIPTGQGSADLTIQPFDDDLVELPETVRVEIQASPSYAVGNASDSLAIFDNDSGGSLPLVNVSVSEAGADEGSGKAGAFLLQRTGATATPLAVDYAVGGTALGGLDYQKLAGRATFPAGSSRVRVYVKPLQDSLQEGAESVILRLRSSSLPPHQNGIQAQAEIRIADDESPPPATTGLVLDLAMLTPGGMFIATLAGRAKGDIFGLWLAMRSAYLPLPGLGTVQVDPGFGLQFAIGTFGGSATANVALPIPGAVTDLIGQRLFFQAWAQSTARVELSNLVVRNLR